MLKDRLHEKNITVAELARIVGTNPDYLYRVYSAGWKPKIDLAVRIARALDTTVEELWGAQVEDFRPPEAANGD